MKKFLILAVVLMTLALSSCFVAEDTIKGARTISARTLDGDNILANYEWYHSTYTDVISKVLVFNNYKRQLGGTKDQDMQNRMLIEQNGVFAYINDLCGQYNARSKMINRKLFKDKSLPWSLNFNVDDTGKGILQEE